MKSYLVVLTLIALSPAMFSQNTYHEIKINALSAVIGELNLAYEHGFNDEVSGGIWIGYNENDLLGQLDNDTRQLHLMPEIRFYFSPDYGGDRAYVGGYLRHRRFSANSNSYTISDTNSSGSQVSTTYDNVDFRGSGTSLGFMLGRKWVADVGFTFETNIGIGRYFHKGSSYSNEIVDQYFDDQDVGEISDLEFDFRLGLTFGWRF